MTGFVEKKGTYKRTGKTRWVARYRGADRRERQKAFPRRVDAEAWLKERQAELVRGDWVPPERAQRSFGALAEEWLSLHTGKPSTIAGYRSVLNRHVLPRFGKRPIGTIERPEVRRFARRSDRRRSRPRQRPERHQRHQGGVLSRGGGGSVANLPRPRALDPEG